MQKIVDISAFLVIIGVLLLFFIVQTFEANHVAIEQINNDMIGDIVETQGNIVDFHSSDNHYFLEIGNDTSIDVVFFSQIANRNPVLEKIQVGNEVAVKGKVSIYNTQLEIIGDRIWLVG